MKFPALSMRSTFTVLIATLTVMIALTVPAVLAEQTQKEKPIRIFAYGDSLTAGFHLPPDASFPAQLQMALREKGYKVDVYNAGISGDTTSSALRRFDWSIGAGGDAVILELGGNDILRGFSPDLTRQNLEKMIERFREKNMEILLAGMYAPANWGKDVQSWFDAIYPELAKKHGTLLYPFFLDGVALNRNLMMKDGIHPTKEGVQEIVKRILPEVEKLIARVKERKAASAE